MENHLISVIIPVYNVEKYAYKCVESVIGQTYKDLEIILVDDGSTDNSGAICDELAKSDGRIRVFHTRNSGVAAARNLGIKKSTGEYITFVDSDDYVTADYILHLYELIQRHGAEISVTGFRVLREGEKTPEEKQISPYTIVMNREEALETLMLQTSITFHNCFRLFYRALFAGLEYPSIKVYEDQAIMYKLFDKAERIVYSPVADYVYLYRRGSLFHSPQRQYVKDYVALSEEMKEYIGNKYPDLLEAVKVKCFCANVNSLKNIGFREIYRGEFTYVRANIIKYRKSVLLNPKALFRHRAGAALSYAGIWVLKAILSIC